MLSYQGPGFNRGLSGDSDPWTIATWFMACLSHLASSPPPIHSQHPPLASALEKELPLTSRQHPSCQGPEQRQACGNSSELDEGAQERPFPEADCQGGREEVCRGGAWKKLRNSHRGGAQLSQRPRATSAECLDDWGFLESCQSRNLLQAWPVMYLMAVPSSLGSAEEETVSLRKWTLRPQETKHAWPTLAREMLSSLNVDRFLSGHVTQFKPNSCRESLPIPGGYIPGSKPAPPPFCLEYSDVQVNRPELWHCLVTRRQQVQRLKSSLP